MKNLFCKEILFIALATGLTLRVTFPCDKIVWLSLK